MNSYKNQGLH